MANALPQQAVLEYQHLIGPALPCPNQPGREPEPELNLSLKKLKLELPAQSPPKITAPLAEIAR